MIEGWMGKGSGGGDERGDIRDGVSESALTVGGV